jgi:hypothetical protein
VVDLALGWEVGSEPNQALQQTGHAPDGSPGLQRRPAGSCGLARGGLVPSWATDLTPLYPRAATRASAICVVVALPPSSRRSCTL